MPWQTWKPQPWQHQCSNPVWNTWEALGANKNLMCRKCLGLDLAGTLHLMPLPLVLPFPFSFTFSHYLSYSLFARILQAILLPSLLLSALYLSAYSDAEHLRWSVGLLASSAVTEGEVYNCGEPSIIKFRPLLNISLSQSNFPTTFPLSSTGGRGQLYSLSLNDPFFFLPNLDVIFSQVCEIIFFFILFAI